MITPLVKVAKRPTEWLPLIAWYGLGTLLASVALGTTLGWLGSVLLPVQWRSGAVLVVAFAGVALALSDLGLGRLGTPTLSRQTHPIWWRTLGPTRAMFLWGVDLGLGFTTIRVASLYWVVALVAFVLASPLTGAVILAAYGLALLLNLSVGVVLFERMGHDAHANIVALRLAVPLSRALAPSLLVWSLSLIVLSV